MHFRYAFFELSKGKHPDSPAWLTRRSNRRLPELLGDFRLVSRLIQESEGLHRVLSGASLHDIARNCRFPDFLGYLGLGLLYTQRVETKQRLLTPLWGRQLLELVMPGSPAATMLRKRVSEKTGCLEWRDLETVEQGMELAYRLHNFE